MSIKFDPIEQQYYLLVNDQQMYDQAVQLGYAGVILTSQDALDAQDIANVIETGKSVVWFRYCPEEEPWDGTFMRRRHIDNSDQYEMIYLLPCLEPPAELQGAELFSFAVTSIPSRKDLEEYFEYNGFIASVDYEGRCGNCHAVLGHDDKYCRYCGTKRGEGAFAPYKNEFYCVYGPPVKKKYKCQRCGHIWITSTLGTDSAKYCPLCGEEVTVIEEKWLDMSNWFVGYEEPYDEENKPVLFSEEEIETLLSCRNEEKKRVEHIGSKDVFDALSKAGVEIPVAEKDSEDAEDSDKELDSFDDGYVDMSPRTEKQGEQINLAYIILSLKGKNLHGIKDAICPHCGSTCAAALLYRIRGVRYRDLVTDAHAPIKKDALLCRDSFDCIDYPLKDEAAEYPAYICLQCGTRYGKYELPKGIDLLYKADITRHQLSKAVKDVGYAAIGVGAKAGEAIKPVTDKIEDMTKSLPSALAKYAEKRKSTSVSKKEKKEDSNHTGKQDDGKKTEKATGGNKLADRLTEATADYNAAYTSVNDHGTKLFVQRERSLNLLDNVEKLINSIANHPKEFDADIAEIQVMKKDFREAGDFAKEELEAAKKSALGVGAGVAGGMAVASLAPSAAMWIATTFGTASTGTAISALSGAAATNAALAWLGGGALAAGGGGMAAGHAFLALAGPIGWGISGATLLASIVLFSTKKVKLNKERLAEIKAVQENTEQMREIDEKLKVLLQKTIDIREGLASQYDSCMKSYGKEFIGLEEEAKQRLGTLVNNAKALAASLNKGV